MEIRKYASIKYNTYFSEFTLLIMLTELNRLMTLLDTAASKALSETDAFSPERKERVISDVPSALKPPPDAPPWALRKPAGVSEESGEYKEHFCLV